MKRLAIAVTNHPWRVLIAWIAIAAIAIGLTAPGSAVDSSKVMKSDQTNFLPNHYESVRAAQLQEAGFPRPDGATTTIVIRRGDHAALTNRDVVRATKLIDRSANVDGVRAAMIDRSGLAPNHEVLLGTVLFERTLFDQQLRTDVHALRDRTDAQFAGSGLVAGYAGEAAQQVDAAERESLTGQLSMLVILVLLIVLFRSIAVGTYVLVASLVGAVALGIIVIGADVFGFALDTTITGLMPIVVLGVGTDYVVFLLHRYRERLRAGDEPRRAMRHAITRIGPAIGFSAMTVVVSLSALLLSSLKSFQVLGPALGFSVLATLFAALTLVPAVAILFGRKLFWPGRSLQQDDTARQSRTERFVTGKPLGTALAAAVVLIALAVPALGFKPDYDQSAEVSGSPSAKAFHDLRAGFPKGALEPTQVMVRNDRPGRLTRSQLDQISRALSDTKGVGEVQQPVVSKDGRIAQIDALLSNAPFTSTALNTIDRDVRPAMAKAAPSGTTVEVGGSTSAYADVRDAIKRDQKVIFPVAALLVGLILVVLLRSLAVPVFVMIGVAVGFVATLGASVLVFQTIGGSAGLTFDLPLVVYLFVASMTSDYAILVLARVREELRDGRPPAAAVATALRTAGPSVVAAGAILAASFGVLIVSPVLSQIGFAIAAGILLSSILTARVLIPALTLLGGHRAWWPSRLEPVIEEVPRAKREEVLTG
jgi:putative drug exporter of the RND superfamily